MALLEGDSGPEVFFGSQVAWWLVVMEFEGHEMLDVLVAVLLGTYQPQRRTMSAVERMPFDRQREEHSRGQHVFATEHRPVAVGADGHQAVLCRQDVLTSGVLLALSLEGHLLDSRHGAPLRLVSPEQYGYKNVKHLVALELHDHQPPGSLGAKEHLRARVALEERHSRLPARFLRMPYRLLIPITVLVSERHAT